MPSGSGNVRQLLLLRHGRTASSESGLFTGRHDVPLNERGRADATAWRTPIDALAQTNAVTAWSSPLIRCRETAELAGLGAMPSALLAEWDLGDIDGENAEAYRATNPEWNLFTDGAPGGESPNDVAARVDEALQLATTGAESVVFVTHGQYTKAFVARALGLPLAAAGQFSLGPARGAILLQRARGISLAGWNIPASSDTMWKELT